MFSQWVSRTPLNVIGEKKKKNRKVKTWEGSIGRKGEEDKEAME